MSLINIKKLEKESDALYKYFCKRNLRNADIELVLNDYLRTKFGVMMLDLIDKKLEEVKKNDNTRKK